MSVCPAWISRSSRCARTSTARSPRTCSATSARPTTPTRRRRRSSRFIRATWRENRTSRNRWTNTCAANPGCAYMRRNAKGAIDGVMREEPPQAGRECLPHDRRAHPDDRRRSAARASGRGAAVVVDPNNGNILAMASVPSFDPNTFIPSIKAKDWDELRKDDARSAHQPRGQRFPPGSTFKLVTALAGLRKGLAQHALQLLRRGQLTAITSSNAGSPRRVASTARSGSPTRSRFPATRSSINSGNAAGIDAIDATGEALGLGKATGIDITGEAAGRFAGAGLDADPVPEREVVLGLHGECFDRPGLRSRYARCKWRWSTRRSPTAAFPIIRGWSIRCSTQDGTPMLDDERPARSFRTTPKVRADFR